MSEIKAVSYQIHPIGKRIKKSKLKHHWQIYLNNQYFSIQLTVSKYSKKKSLLVNSEPILPNQKQEGLFQHKFTLLDYQLVLIEQGKQFDLRIEGQSFCHLYLAAQQNFQFEDQIRNSYPKKQEKAQISAFVIQNSTPVSTNFFDLKQSDPYSQWGRLQAKSKPVKALKSPNAVSVQSRGPTNFFQAPQVQTQQSRGINEDLFQQPSSVGQKRDKTAQDMFSNLPSHFLNFGTPNVEQNQMQFNQQAFYQQQMFMTQFPNQQMNQIQNPQIMNQYMTSGIDPRFYKFNYQQQMVWMQEQFI